MSNSPNVKVQVSNLDGPAKVRMASDGTGTRVSVWGGVTYIATFKGEGVARRRKGDPRSPRLGERLALARALRDAADRAAKQLADEGYVV